jgi:pimeloyl-ACP methyl ester carboxylesterase
MRALALTMALAGGGCAASARAGDYFAAPLYRPAAPTTTIEARWRVQPAPAGCGASGAPIVFLPALGLTQHTWAGVTATLAACRPRVLVDLPGLGEAPFAARFDDEMALRALADVIDAVAPGGRVMLAGHSLGAAIAVRLSERLGARVEALVLVAAPVAPFALGRIERFLLLPSVWPPLLHLSGPSAGIRLGLARVAGGGEKPSDLDVALIGADWSDRRRRGAVRAYYRAFLDAQAVPRSEAALERVRVPTLLVWGEQDLIVPRDVLFAIERRLRAVAPAVRVVPGAGHLVPLSAPAAVADAIDGFVASLPTARTQAPSQTPPLAARATVATGRRPESRVWGPGRELHPLVGVGALFAVGGPLDGKSDVSFVAGLARGGIDPSYPVESGRLAFTAGAALRADANGASFAYLRATARLELVWRWGGGVHLDGTLMVDPRDGRVGGYGALGYAPSVVPWARAFVGWGALPGDAARALIGLELDARLDGLWY